MRRFSIITAAVLGAAAPAGAQSHRLTYVRDTAFELSGQGFRQPPAVLIGRDGRMVVAPQFSVGEAIQLDSAGRPLKWKLPIGFRSEVGWVNAWGWCGDSLWIADQSFGQIAMVGANAKVTSSVPFPTWIRPFWKDRRQYPLFSRMTWYAMYGDGTLLVEPSVSRRLLDTPGYDPGQKLLVRVDRDGRILRTVARMPLMEGRMQLRSGTERRWVNVPYYARAFWKAAADGERVAVVSPIPADSGAFRVTVVNGQGDTVFSRRYAVEGVRVPRASVDSFLKTVLPFGRYTGEQVRDTIAKQIPAFMSPVTGVMAGIDHSVWVAIRVPRADPTEARWFVVDSAGDPAGIATFPRGSRWAEVSLHRLWVLENDRVKQRTTIVRYRRSDAKPARVALPARSAPASASPSSAPPRE